MPENESAMLEALCRDKILDTSVEEAFNDFTRLAAQLCETPIALMTLIECGSPASHPRADCQQLKSLFGLTPKSTSGEIDFSAMTIRQNEVLIIQDTLADERFATNPLVNGDPHIRFYAGVPLITAQGHPRGTLGVMDYGPRKLNPPQLEALRALSRQLSVQLDLQEQLLEIPQVTQKNKQLEEKLHHREQEVLDLLENSAVGLHCVDPHGVILWANKAELELLGYSREEYIGQHIANFYADQEISNDVLKKLSQKETLQNYEARLL